jgi:hypothetical protein
MNKKDDPLLAHEAMDRASIMMEMFESTIMEHEFFKSHPEFKQIATNISLRLGQLYQDVAGVAMPTPAPKKAWRVPTMEDLAKVGKPISCRVIDGVSAFPAELCAIGYQGSDPYYVMFNSGSCCWVRKCEIEVDQPEP